ncbi:MAG: hypothetical protein QN144_10275 [Armatimonadota bacterium]|nr:hypothetical protein [Armatimonadota bacterium]
MQLRVVHKGPDLDAVMSTAEDYLRRSREELSLEEEQVVLEEAAGGHRPDLLLLGAFDEAGQLLGWCLLMARGGTQVTGVEVLIWQLYVVPGRGRLKDLLDQGLPAVMAFARGAGASRVVMVTRRLSAPYMSMLRRAGFSPYAIVMHKEVQ